ncbi:alpha/beta fold hydrolase [Flavobacterium humi]|uniref:Alpha/beta fold hydrolase n=1 Tax=Flavobacterium humi TaxID=2562683 RepID=A0A4Z0L9T4_9FLAO|nr:alpha/beta fold hydrolase [Flavobacterium humi]TGD58581.1 alpha/beta fold hydrolase [Flavobacterium humi]
MVRLAWTLALILITAITTVLRAQSPVPVAGETFPERKAFIGFLGKPTEKGISIDSVLPNSTASKLKLKKGDVIQSINGNATSTLELYAAAASAIRANDKITAQYTRNGKTATATTKAVVKPLETSVVADIMYDWVRFRNGYLRTITRKPKGKENVPCILLIPGYGCGSIENYSKSYNGKLMDEWLKNGFAVVTIEKSGLGDSFGCEACAEADLLTDIESFDAGYSYMERLSFVDKANLFIWGHSMGGTIAPEVAKKHHPKGVMVFGSVFRPWSEFLLEMHRVQKPLLENLTYQQTEDFTRKIQKIYYEFFVLKKSPATLSENPEYNALVVSELNYKPGSTNMWGRSWKFWQQLDTLDLAKSWQEVNCPVLILHGGTDYEQCSLVEPMLTQKTINEKHPNTATWITIPDLDHFMMKSKDWPEAVKNFNEQQYAKGNFNEKIAQETVKWLQSKV